MSQHDGNGQQPQAPKKGPSTKTLARRQARTLAMQALYSWHMAGQSLNEIEAQFRVDNDFTAVDGAYFHEILPGVPRQNTAIDGAFQTLPDRPLDDHAPVELSVLPLSDFELTNPTQITYP